MIVYINQETYFYFNSPTASSIAIASTSKMNEERRHTSRQPKDPSRPAITKEDVGKAERMVADAVQMFDAAMSRHATKALAKEKRALNEICKSAEFKSEVAAFRRDVVGFIPKVKRLDC